MLFYTHLIISREQHDGKIHLWLQERVLFSNIVTKGNLPTSCPLPVVGGNLAQKPFSPGISPPYMAGVRCE